MARAKRAFFQAPRRALRVSPKRSKSQKDSAPCLGEAAGAVEGGGGAGEEMGVGAVVVAVEEDEVVASAQELEEGAGVAQAVEVAGFVEGVVGHQEDVAADGDFGAVEEAGRASSSSAGTRPLEFQKLKLGRAVLKAMATASSPIQRTRG
jgi:hypothetical protein